MIWIYLFLEFCLCFASITADAECPDVENKDEVTFTYKSKCYEYVESIETEVSFASAAEDCRRKDGRLVKIPDNTTQAELVERLKYMSDSHTVIIGLRQIGNQWTWTTGESLSYSYWNSDTSCNGTCACAVLNLSTGGMWETHGCETYTWFAVHVCEYGSSKGTGFTPSNILLATAFVFFTKMTQGRKSV